MLLVTPSIHLVFCSFIEENFVLQRLQALDDGWVELLQMWENRQQLLSQSLNFQVIILNAWCTHIS